MDRQEFVKNLFEEKEKNFDKRKKLSVYMYKIGDNEVDDTEGLLIDMLESSIDSYIKILALIIEYEKETYEISCEEFEDN